MNRYMIKILLVSLIFEQNSFFYFTFLTELRVFEFLEQGAVNYA